jgi:hypothetical protein
LCCRWRRRSSIDHPRRVDVLSQDVTLALPFVETRGRAWAVEYSVMTDGDRLVAFVRAVSGPFFLFENFGFEANFLDLTGPAADV